MADPHSSREKIAAMVRIKLAVVTRLQLSMKWCKVMDVYFLLWGCAEMSVPDDWVAGSGFLPGGDSETQVQYLGRAPSMSILPRLCVSRGP